MQTHADIENTPEAWSIRAATIASEHEACGWTASGQTERHNAAVDALQPKPRETFLDFGCGTGSLSSLLADDIKYVGYDWAPGMIDRAKEEHPGRRFQTWEPTQTFDLVACIGPFNLPGHWSKDMTWLTLRRLWDKTSRALFVSLYAGSDEHCICYTLEECERYAGGESFYRAVSRWRHNDILILLQRHT